MTGPILRSVFALILAAGSGCLGQSFLDFEFIPGGLPSEGLAISNQWQASLGISFILEDNTMPTLSQVGAPRTAFNGFGGPDLPAPGTDVGQFFLTDDGVLSNAPPALLVNYAQPASAASADILDIDFSEQWTVEAKDAAGNVLGTQVLSSGGNGTAVPFNFDFGSPVISQIRIAFTGSGGSIGLAFDNFLTVSPGAGSGQANSAEARLEINRQGASGTGPFDVSLFAGGSLEFRWSGPAMQPVILFSGPVNGGALPIPCLGSVDIGTAPTFGDIAVVFDGTVFPQSLFFTLDAGGSLSHTTAVPVSASGLGVGFQGLVLQPLGSPCGAVLTAAFDLQIL